MLSHSKQELDGHEVKARLGKLKRDIWRKEAELARLTDNQGLTPLGQAIMVSDKERQTKADRQEVLKSEIEEKELAIEALSLKLKQHVFLFSGDVWIRSGE